MAKNSNKQPCMVKYLKLLRVKHYLKNVLVFVPLFFSQVFFTDSLMRVLLGFISFSLMSSTVYIINDIQDAEQDKNHPIKCLRPIASGEVSVPVAKALCVVCFLLSIAATLIAEEGYFSTLVLAAYLFLNVFYSAGLKSYPIIDIVILATGFVLRVIYGAIIADVWISGWLYLVIWTGALYMALGKRRNEIQKIKAQANTRAVLKHYSIGFLDKNMYVCVALANVFYALWAQDHESQLYLWSVPIFMLILMKYSLDIESDSDGDPTEVILKDKLLLCLVVLLVLYLFVVLYV